MRNTPLKSEKLARDNIIDIIKRKNKACVWRIAETSELEILLRQKLQEEVDEYLVDSSSEELADILEVVEALAENAGISLAELKTIQQQKKDTRGGFQKGIVLALIHKEEPV